MELSPPLTPLDDVTSRSANSTEGSSLQATHVKLNWKTPIVSNRAGKRAAQRSLTHQSDNNDDKGNGDGKDCGNDDDNSAVDDDDLLALPPLPMPSLRAPTLKAPLEAPPKRDDVQSSQEGLQVPSSSLSIADTDEGGYELELVLLEEEEYTVPEWNRHRTSTGLSSLDERLNCETHEMTVKQGRGNGLACGSILEVAGSPGSGKTTLLLQIAVQERLAGLLRARASAEMKREEESKEWGESAQQVLLIDTEGSVGMDRIVDVAKTQIGSIQPPLSPLSKTALLRNILAGIHYCRCTSDYEMMALFLTLLPYPRRSNHQPHHSARNGNMNRCNKTTLPSRTSLILIDTISYPLRAPLPDDDAPRQRNQRKAVVEELRQFSERCRRRGIKLVLANQMAITIIGKDGLPSNLSDKDGKGQLAPLLRNQKDSILGHEVWRLVLFRAGCPGLVKNTRFGQIIGQPASMGKLRERENFDLIPWIPLTIQRGGIKTA